MRASHNLTVASAEPLSTKLDMGCGGRQGDRAGLAAAGEEMRAGHAPQLATWNRTQLTESVCPRIVCRQRSVLRSQTLSVLSMAPLTRKSPE